MDNKIFDLGKIGITIKGEWSENTYYERLTIVTYNRKVYISTKDNVNTNPEIDNIGWHLLIEPIDGVTPILKAESGENINIPGTPSVSVRKENDNVIFIFDNLKGDKGDKGDQGLQGIKGDKGDQGEGFSIFKTYPSLESMESDKDNVPEGKFVLIASNVEEENNAKLFVKSKIGFVFLTDLSGSQGIKGDKGDKGDTIKPQFSLLDNGHVQI